jgi:anti-sigma factor RsiW
VACDAWRGRVEAYADGELPESERRDFDLHLKSCASCAAEAVALLQQKRLTQAAGKRYSPSPEFRRRMEQTLVARRRPSFQGAWLRAWAPQLAVAAVLIVSLGTLYGWRQASEREQILGEVADLHVTGLASSNPVDVVSSDRHTVKPWFQGRLPFSFDLPELQDSGFTLAGGRVAYLEHEPGAHLVYELRKHKISVFIFRDTGRLEGLKGSGLRHVLSFQVESWASGGLRYFVVGDANPQEIQRLSQMYRAAAVP